MAIQNKIPAPMGSMTVGVGMAEWGLDWVLLAVLVGYLVEVVFRPVKGVSALGVFGNEQHHLMQLQPRRRQRLLEKPSFFTLKGLTSAHSYPNWPSIPRNLW
jgi:hypothetical protein